MRPESVKDLAIVLNPGFDNGDLFSFPFYNTYKFNSNLGIKYIEPL